MSDGGSGSAAGGEECCAVGGAGGGEGDADKGTLEGGCVEEKAVWFGRRLRGLRGGARGSTGRWRSRRGAEDGREVGEAEGGEVEGAA